MLRVTTNSTIYTYQKNLLKSTNQLYSAMSAMMSGRNFDSYSADPAAATRAFKIHSSLNATNAQYSNNTTVLNKFSTAWDVADDMIDKLVSDLAQAPALKGLSDTNLSTLNTQGDVIYSGAEAIIQSLNGKYDDNYLFNGADTQNPPFALEQDGDRTYVTYRGVRIDDPATLDQPYTDENGNNVLKDDGVTPMTNREMLEQWSDEHLYPFFQDIALHAAPDKYNELIAAQPADHIVAAEGGLQQRGNPLEDLIALQMSEPVIDSLEVIHIQQNQNAFPARLRRHILLHFAAEGGAVIYPGQRIPAGSVPVRQFPSGLAVDIFQIEQGICIFRKPLPERVRHQFHPVPVSIQESLIAEALGVRLLGQQVLPCVLRRLAVLGQPLLNPCLIPCLPEHKFQNAFLLVGPLVFISGPQPSRSADLIALQIHLRVGNRLRQAGMVKVPDAHILQFQNPFRIHGVQQHCHRPGLSLLRPGGGMAGAQLEPLVGSALAAQQDFLIIDILAVGHILKQLGKPLGKMGMDHLPIQPALGEVFLIGLLSGQQTPRRVEIDSAGSAAEDKHLSGGQVRQIAGAFHIGNNPVAALQAHQSIGILRPHTGTAHNGLTQKRMEPGILQLHNPAAADHLLHGLLHILLVAVLNPRKPVPVALFRGKRLIHPQNLAHGLIGKHLLPVPLGGYPNEPQSQLRVFQHIPIMQIQQLA